MSDNSELERRATAWRRACMEDVCDVIEPWEHGTVFRATHYPSFYDYNVVWVEGDPGLSADELVEVANDALTGYEHRRLDFESADAGEAIRAGLEAARWEPTRLLWMLHTEPLPPPRASISRRLTTTWCGSCASHRISRTSRASAAATSTMRAKSR
jgi:hypothetical protein